MVEFIVNRWTKPIQIMIVGGLVPTVIRDSLDYLATRMQSYDFVPEQLRTYLDRSDDFFKIYCFEKPRLWIDFICKCCENGFYCFSICEEDFKVHPTLKAYLDCLRGIHYHLQI